MKEPIGLIVDHFSEAVGVHPEMMRIFMTMMGALFLAIEFHRKKSEGRSVYAAIGWLLSGISVYLLAEHYVEIEDPVLVIMTSICLPASVVLAYVEMNGSRLDPTLVWLRGAVAWSVIPYYVVYAIPVLNMGFNHGLVAKGFRGRFILIGPDDGGSGSRWPCTNFGLEW